jgi:hypothetical protein
MGDPTAHRDITSKKALRHAISLPSVGTAALAVGEGLMELAGSRRRWSIRSFCSDKSCRYVTNQVRLAFYSKVEMSGSNAKGGGRCRLLQVRYT